MRTRSLELLTALFVTALLISNIIAGKIGQFGPLFLPVAVIVFPVSYILSDILTEVYGYAVMRRVIWTGFLCNLLAVVLVWIAIEIPSAPFFDGQEAFARTLGSAPRILGASFAAYLVGEFSNSFVLAKLKVKTAGRHLWLRTIGSTLVGQGLDSAVFISLAFWGAFPPSQILTLAVTQWLFKTAFEAVATPVTYAVVGRLKRIDGVDAYDKDTDFNPLRLA